ncbi:MAG: quinonprotein alcohol dehydrogenase, partial [Thermoleophilia bacterium]|nr:quinonprotein alcohol dehydrogenase [Thermoleophilia bacterium]
STVCCGWLSRGVAIGDGKVYIGKLDGHMVALDQKTGEVEWDVEVVDWKESNGGITAAPLYYDGRIYTGTTGGEFGVRGFVTALDADTGKEDWKFFTTAGPEHKDIKCNEGDACDTADESWEGDSYKTGGAPVWQTPSVDPKLGTIYFTTGNANPDVDGSGRGGANLFTASFVALNAKTGKYKWHYQMVHHDIWDYDAPSPTILFDAKVKGKRVPAIAEASKTGWLYALNRKTGKPIWGIKETPVPQYAQQKTHPTQPIPETGNFADHVIDDKEFGAIEAQVKASPEGAKLEVVRPKSDDPADSVFSPPAPNRVTVVAMGPTGGTNWPPSSFNPKERLIYTCSVNGAAGMYPSGVEERKPGTVRLGSILTVLPFGTTPGQLVATNADTGKEVWSVDFEDACYSGSITTGGNLVFVGRNDGHLEAYSADKGEKLWEFQTGAGANNTATTFEHKGKQYVLFLAGGNSLAASPHGDNLWLFSLDGTAESLPGIEKGSAEGGVDHFDAEGNADAGSEEENDEGAKDPGNETEATETGDTKRGGNLPNGETIFADNCSVCHGLSGEGGNGGPPITDQKNLDAIMVQVEKGGNGMPAFGDQLSEQDILDVATYVAESIAGSKN